MPRESVILGVSQGPTFPLKEPWSQVNCLTAVLAPKMSHNNTGIIQRTVLVVSILIFFTVGWMQSFF